MGTFKYDFLLVLVVLVSEVPALGSQNYQTKGFVAKKNNGPFKEKFNFYQSGNTIDYPGDPIIDPNNPKGKYAGCKCENKTIEIEETEYDSQIICFPAEYEETCDPQLPPSCSCDETVREICTGGVKNVTIVTTVQICVGKPSKRCNLSGAEVCETTFRQVCTETPTFHDLKDEDLNCISVGKRTSCSQGHCKEIDDERCTVKEDRKLARIKEEECKDEPTVVCGPARCPIVLTRQQCTQNSTSENIQVNSTRCSLAHSDTCSSKDGANNLALTRGDVQQNCKVKKINPRKVVKSHVLYDCTCQGSWQPWSPYTECSDTCQQTRTRTCDKPDSDTCVKPCPGNSTQSLECPYVPVWGVWSDWSGCSESCGNGLQVRQRECLNPKPLCGKDCDGVAVDFQDCYSDPGCSCSDWTDAQECVAEDGVEFGTKIQRRTCNQLLRSPCDGLGCPEERTVSCTQEIWHMIIGGSNGTVVTDSVELYNYKTNERCFMNASLPIPLSEHSGAVLDGVPYVCGGYSLNNLRQSGCYKFNRDSKFWEEGPSPNVVFNRAGSTFVTSQKSKGWHIFGGYKQFNASYPGVSEPGVPEHFDYKASLTLRHPDFDKWEVGFKLRNYTSVSGQCVVQVNETLTVFFGGDENPTDIITLDWSGVAPIYKESVLAEKLSQPRVHSACSVFKYLDDKMYVAVVGGGSKDIDVWDPSDRTIAKVITTLPSIRNPHTPEIVEPSGGLEFAQLLAVNNRTELLLYGGNMKSERQNRIHSFSFDTNTWTEKCRMLQPRGEHVVLPVTGITCDLFGGAVSQGCGNGA